MLYSYDDLGMYCIFNNKLFISVLLFALLLLVMAFVAFPLLSFSSF